MLLTLKSRNKEKEIKKCYFHNFENIKTKNDKYIFIRFYRTRYPVDKNVIFILSYLSYVLFAQVNIKNIHILMPCKIKCKKISRNIIIFKYLSSYLFLLNRLNLYTFYIRDAQKATRSSIVHYSFCCIEICNMKFNFIYIIETERLNLRKEYEVRINCRCFSNQNYFRNQKYFKIYYFSIYMLFDGQFSIWTNISG